MPGRFALSLIRDIEEILNDTNAPTACERSARRRGKKTLRSQVRSALLRYPNS